jgi:hypothetical protein
MDMRVDQPGKDHQITKVIVSRAIVDCYDHSTLPTHRGWAHFVVEDDTVRAK